MTVTRVRETPRVTKPYTDEQWADAARASARRSSATSRKADVRLTMGGEPTFVSIDDMDGAEWNTLALGPEKRRLAGELFRRLADRFATGPLLHFGQGKWYPGEQLPRWALGCYWRKDGEPIWRDPSADRARSPSRSAPRRETRAALCAAPSPSGCSSIPATCSRPTRTPGTTCGASGGCRATSIRSTSKLHDPLERERLARVFEQGLDTSSATCCRCAREHRRPAAAGAAGRGSCAARSCYLIPGDSPMGYRLPLDSLPWAAPADADFIAEPDPMIAASGAAAARRLPPRAGAAPPGARAVAEANGDGEAARAKPGGARWRPTSPASRASARRRRHRAHRASRFEPRDGHLYVFMPPTERTEDYLDLVAAVEDTAAELGQPVFIEGYPPPAAIRASTVSTSRPIPA